MVSCFKLAIREVQDLSMLFSLLFFNFIFFLSTKNFKKTYSIYFSVCVYMFLDADKAFVVVKIKLCANRKQEEEGGENLIQDLKLFG